MASDQPLIVTPYARLAIATIATNYVRHAEVIHVQQGTTYATYVKTNTYTKYKTCTQSTKHVHHGTCTEYVRTNALKMHNAHDEVENRRYKHHVHKILRLLKSARVIAQANNTQHDITEISRQLTVNKYRIWGENTDGKHNANDKNIYLHSAQ